MLGRVIRLQKLQHPKRLGLKYIRKRFRITNKYDRLAAAKKRVSHSNLAALEKKRVFGHEHAAKKRASHSNPAALEKKRVFGHEHGIYG